MPTDIFCANKVRNLNSGLKFGVRSRVFQYLKKWISPFQGSLFFWDYKLYGRQTFLHLLKIEYTTRKNPFYLGGILDYNALLVFLLVWNAQQQSLFGIWYCRKPQFSLTLNTIPPCARTDVQNKQVCGIICDYKKISSSNEASYALSPYNL